MTERLEMWKFLQIGLVCLLLSVPSTSSAGEKVCRSDLGSAWPFQFECGFLYCKNWANGRKAVLIESEDEYVYAINGSAMSWVKAIQFKDLNGRPARMARDFATGDLMPIIKKGTLLCR
jgi:hypothetical protein